MKTKIKRLLTLARTTAQEPGSFGLLPDIIKILESIQTELENDKPNPEFLTQKARALARVVTDSYNFSESFLGTELLKIVSEIIHNEW